MEPMLSIQEAVAKYIDGVEKKKGTSIEKLLIKAFLAGMMVAFGAAASNVTAHAIENPSLSKLAAGVVFPMGLMMVIFLGAELFTGDCLMVMAVAEHKCSVASMCRILALVYVGNLAGGVLMAALNEHIQFDYNNGLLGAYTIKVALTKCSMSFDQALISGILCNVLVCIAVMLAFSAKDVASKLLSAFFIILLFIANGYEHSVANMYFVPAGLFAKLDESYVQLAMDTYGYTAEQIQQLNVVHFLTNNLIPVTLGNIIGGMFVFGLPLWYVNHSRKESGIRIS